VLRYVEGQTLQGLARRRLEDDGDLRPLLRAFLAACAAVSFAHSRGVLHLDPKPANVLVGDDGTVQLADWGLSLVRPGLPAVRFVNLSESAAHDATPGRFIGTPAFVSPEIAAGRYPDVDYRADVYGLGATLFYLLTGRTHRRGGAVAEVVRQAVEEEAPDARSFNPAAPPALAAVCARALARAPEGRYPTVADLAADVRAWLDGGPVSVYAESWPRRWLRRWRGGP
jgi:serine/threonine protein kinase